MEGKATEMHKITWENGQIQKQPTSMATETTKEQPERPEENKKPKEHSVPRTKKQATVSNVRHI